MEEIKLATLNKKLEEYKKDDKHTVLRHALVKTPLMDVITSQDKIDETVFKFDIDIKTLPIANQKQSGRCWIFAATNVLREIFHNDLGVTDFELSQSYLAFYDRLEKVNYLLEAVIELLDKDHDDRTLTFLLENGIGDGGQWDMFVSLVEKYGLCPKDAYPETSTSSGTAATRSLLNFNVRKFASDAKVLMETKGIKAVRKLKDEVLTKVYYLLVDAYGVPPTKFDFEYVDKEGKYHKEEGLTPLSFKKKYIGDALKDYVSIINAPTKDKPFGKTYTVKYLGNVVGGKVVTHLNVDMARLKELVIAQLKDEKPVWFGSDVGFYGDRVNGAWDDKRFDSKTAFGLDWKMDKGESLDYHASQMSHAMMIVGVAFKGEYPYKWKIENSWGTDAGKGGFYVMSDSWFDQFTYQAVVNKKYLNRKELSALEKKPVELKPWDPMGSLAD